MSFPCRLSDASVVVADAKRAPVFAFSILYSKVTVLDLTSVMTVVTLIVSSYFADEWYRTFKSMTASMTPCASSSAYDEPSCLIRSVRPISHHTR